MHTIVWVIAVIGELLFSFVLFYAVFYSRSVDRQKIGGLVIGVVLWALILGGLAAPAGAIGL